MKKAKLRVGIDTSPLASGHAHRGIGSYTRFLIEELSKLESIDLVHLTTKAEKRRANPDVIHYPYFDLFFSSLPLLEFKKRVVTIHDVIPRKFPDQYPVGTRGKFSFAKQNLALKTVHAIITDSESSKRDIIEHLHISPEKIAVIYLAANPDLEVQSNHTVTKVRRKYGIPPKYLLYVRDINYNKNVPNLVKALKYLSDDIHLVVVGRNFYPHPIPEWKAFDTQVEMSQVRNRLLIVSYLLSDDVTDLSALYSGALCYVQPSYYEGFGLPVLEALRCETPVVSTQNSSLIEVGGKVVEYSVSPESEDLAEAVARVLQLTKTKRMARTRAGVAWEKQFSWQKTAAQTAAIYEKVAQ